MTQMHLDHILNVFRAIGEETRLRMMTLIAQGELTVTELTQILAQSQPRVSRHLKILSDGGLVERYREGAWVFYRLTSDTSTVPEIKEIVDKLIVSEDRIIARDRERLRQVHVARAALASTYFQENASKWDELRRLHLPESDIEQSMRDIVGPTKVDHFVDLGTGTGRMLIVFEDLYQQATGYDLSREMLNVARTNLDEAGITTAQIRQSDLFSLPLQAQTADLVCLHQVLHFLADPAAAVREATRLLKPGGRILITDFASHELEFLRENHAHRRLGFSDDEVQTWCKGNNLNLVRVETLSPTKAEQDKLTVKIWLCAAKVPKGKKSTPFKIDTNLTETTDTSYA